MTPTLTISDTLAAGAYTLTATSSPAPAPTPTADPLAPRDGICFNIDSPTSQSPAPTLYADAMKYSRGWGSWNHPEDQAAPKDALGRPTAATGGKVVFAARPNAAGIYTVRYVGKSNLSLLNSGSSTMTLAYNADQGITTGTINVTGNDLWFRYTGGPPIDLQVLAPGSIPGQKWHPAPLKCLKLGRGVRFMDLMRTNGSPVVRWSDRTQPGCDTANAAAGLPYEDLIDLQNTLGLPAWYCIPHAADDDFVARFGEMLAALVRPDLPIYIQYGNEICWNFAGVFNVAYQYNLAQAKAEVAAGDTTLSDGGTDTNVTQWAWKREAKRICQIRKLFPADPRFRFIVESQHNYSASDPGRQARIQLAYIAAHWGAPEDWIYAIASAPYGGASAAAKANANLTLAEYIADLRQDAVGAASNAEMKARVALAAEYGIRYVGYEADPNGDYQFANMATLLAAQAAPEMQQITEDYYAGWFGAGGNEIFHFVAWSNHGPVYDWGAAPDPTQLTAPKLAAIAAINAKLGAA